MPNSDLYLDDDVLDFDEELEPDFAAAVADAEARSRLIDDLVKRRRALGLKQKQVAAAMGTAQSFVSDFENGRTDPHLSTFQRYARAVEAAVLVNVSPSLPVAWDGWAPNGTMTSHSARRVPIDRNLAEGLAASVGRPNLYVIQGGVAA